MKKFTADFETAIWLEDETFVWAWAVCEIGNEENIIIENNIESFISFCKKQKNATFYFHNLKFDGEFIISYLLKNGYTYRKDKKDVGNKTFTTLISDFGVFYQITIYFSVSGNKKVKATFIDSLKIIPFSVKQIAKAFDLEEQKLEIDYKKERSRNHTLTKEEKDNIKNDVVIVAKALNVIFSEGLTKMTQGSNALFDFKRLKTKKDYERFFPTLTPDVDEKIRKSYKGGFTYLNPLYKEKEVKNINVLDVNSLYPSVMRFEKLPYGEPLYFKGKYKEDKVYDLYVQTLTCSFKIKENMIPTIQIKNDRFHFKETEYLESSKGEIVYLALTSVDLELFFKHYDVYNLKYIEGYKFKSINGIFDDYIDKWIGRKIKASKEGNKRSTKLKQIDVKCTLRKIFHFIKSSK